MFTLLSDCELSPIFNTADLTQIIEKLILEREMNRFDTLVLHDHSIGESIARCSAYKNFVRLLFRSKEVAIQYAERLASIESKLPIVVAYYYEPDVQDITNVSQLREAKVSEDFCLKTLQPIS